VEFLQPLWQGVLWLWDFLIRLDKHLADFIQTYGTWTYALLFLVVFCETGLVVTPFLPGDSLLFIAGALAAKGGLNVHLLVALLITAAILGDAVNYAAGRYLGPKVFRNKDARLLNPAHLEAAHAFYEKHGGKAIIIARFVPIIRTYAPFVAGMAKMEYRQFAFYNVAGALLWVVSLTYIGYFFGNIPIIKQHLTLIIFGIIGVSIMPIVWAWASAKLAARRAAP
jgi:membrane-associated protein